MSTTIRDDNELDQYVNSLPFAVLAYERPDGTPIQRRFGRFAKHEQIIFFSTRIDAAKVKALESHPRVSFLFEAADQKLSEWKSVLVIGNAVPVTEGSELAVAVGALSERNPRFKERVSKEGLTNTRLFSLRAEQLELLDYSKGIGHSETVSFAKAEELKRNAATSKYVVKQSVSSVAVFNNAAPRKRGATHAIRPGQQGACSPGHLLDITFKG